MSILVRIETDLGKIGHAFASGAAKLKAVLSWAAAAEDKIEPDVAKVEAVANKIVGAIYPGAEVVVLAIEAVFGKALDAVDGLAALNTLDGLAALNTLDGPVSVSLDAATVQKLKDALPIVKAQAMTVPGS